MPNQPALIGEGMSVLVATGTTTPAQRAQAFYICESTGKALWLGDEDLMDAVTAVSGSGPAYFYLLMELMEQSAVALGLPADVARTLVRQTALGAAHSAADPAADVAALRRSVTSPGGTTAAALAVLEQAGLADILHRALTAARDRGIELGRSPR
jgi:pyrroline-5-carboxylate reductase